MKIQEVRELIRLIDQSKYITEFEYENDGAIVKIKKEKKETKAHQESIISSTPAESKIALAEHNEIMVKEESTASVKEKGNLKQISSPMVGTFYLSPSPEEPPFVSVGERVTADTVVCILEAMKLFNELKAEVSGEIVEILADNGQLVEFGQPLFLVKEG